MGKFMSRLLASAAIIGGVTLAANPAEAQRVTRIVALGDSYIDDGNVFELTGTPRPPIYPLGRFSNGTNLVDTLSQILGRPVLNYGIGGAVARAQNTNLPQVQAFDVQVQSFLAGGGPPAFPRSTGRFAPDDLLIVNIGANDARAYSRQFGVNPTAAQITQLQAGVPAQAQLAAADAVRNLNALVAVGARNMTVLGGDTGILPEIRGLPVAAVGSAYSNAFNAQVRTALAGYAANGVIVNYLDLTLIGQRVEQNLAAFNLTSAGAASQADVAAGRSDNFLFYVDQVHLTQAGYAIVGRYAARQLEAPLHLEAQAETALFAAEGFADALEGRLDLAAADEGNHGPPIRLFIGGDYGQRDTEAGSHTLAFSQERTGVHAGIEYHAGRIIVGALIAASRGDTELEGGTGDIDTDTLAFGAYAAFSTGNFFLEGFGGIGRTELDIRRTAVIDDIRADAEADTLVAGAQAGYLFGLGPVRIGPVVGINYARAEIDGFTETGDPVLTLAVQNQDDDALVGSVGIEANASLGAGPARISPFLVARIEKELRDEERTIRYALTAAPTIVNSWTVGGESDDPYGRLAAGVNVGILGSVTLQVTGSTTIDRHGGDNTSATAALRVGF